MGRFTKRLIGGLTAALMVAGGAFAQETSLLADFENNSNQNLFGDYWYYFDDNKEKSTLSGIASQAKGVGNSTVASADVKGSGATKELLFTKEKSITAGRNGLGAKMQFTWGNAFLTAYDNRTPANAREPGFTGDSIWNNTSGLAQGVTGDVSTCISWKCGPYYFSPFVGIGTNLVEDGSEYGPAGIANATSFNFWAKAESALSAWVFFEQSDIGWYDGGSFAAGGKRKEGAFFGKWVTVGTQWALHTVDLTTVADCNGDVGTAGNWDCDDGKEGLRQPMWISPDEQDFKSTFDRSKIVKVAWQVQAANGGSKPQGNGNLHVDVDLASIPGYTNTLYLDDISFTGFRFVAKDMCEECIVTSKPSTGAFPFDQFAQKSNQNALSQYWYVYDDTRTETDDGEPGTSRIGEQGVEKDCESQWVDVEKGECEVIIQDADESSDVNYLSGRFQLGNSILIETNDVQPFVGIGTNLYDDKADVLDFYDADEAGIKGLYFEYKTVEGTNPISKISFEVQDNYDATGVRPAASVYYIDLPATGGEWFKANVAFSKLVQHTGWESVREWNAANPDKVALNTSKLAKFQFKVQDGTGKNGYLQLRNVNTLGAAGVPVRLAGSQAKSIGLRATYNRGVVGVNWNAAQSIASGKVSLVNIKGRTVASAPLVKAGSKVTANLGKGTIPTGMYFVRINARDVQGKQVVQQVPLSIVK